MTTIDAGFAQRVGKVFCLFLLLICPAAAQEREPQIGFGAEPQPKVINFLSTNGYYQVTPSGGLVLFPIHTQQSMAAMQGILAEAPVGLNPLFFSRGYYEITAQGQLVLHPPEGATAVREFQYFGGAYGLPRIPGMHGMPGIPPGSPDTTGQ